MTPKEIGAAAARVARQKRFWMGLALLASVVIGPAAGVSIERIGEAVTLLLAAAAPADLNAAE